MAKKRLNRKNKRENNQGIIRVENTTDKLFLLHLKKSLYVIIIWALSIIVHNLIQRLTGIDEDLFSTISIYLIPLYLLVSIIYTLSKHKRLDKK